MSTKKINRRNFLKLGVTGGAITATSKVFPRSNSVNIYTVNKSGIKNKDDFEAIYRFVNSLPAFSDHDHHQVDKFFTEKMTLDNLLKNSLVAWTGHRSDGSLKSREKLLHHVRFNSYFYWLEKGLQKLHSIEEPINLETWERISQKLMKTYKQYRDFHWKSLMENGFEKVILDTYWDPGSDNGHPEIFIASFRIDKFIYGFHGESVARNNIIPWKHYGFKGNTLDDFVDLMRETIRARYQAGKIVALKCAQAYRRTIDFLPDDKFEANRIFGIHPKKINPTQRILFGNYIFNRCCEIAAELDIPFQIHTGLARLQNSHPMKLLPIIERHPKTRFVLFHSGYPWTNETSGLAHNYPNVLPNLTWTVTISTAEAIRVLHDYIDIARSINSITWGSDAWIPEESVGALLAWKFVIAKVLWDRLNDGLLNIKNAERLARKLMFENGRKVYMKI